MSACDGACCAAFPMSQDPEDHDMTQIIDGRFIEDMVIEITASEAILRREVFGGKPIDDEDVTSGRRFYKCRHWDEETRLCGAYDDRPDMCRRFPYGKDCEHGCSCRGSETVPE